MSDARHRLAVYGSLAPGEANHDQLAGLEGRWEEGWVRGRLHDRGWGAAEGFPGLVPDPDGDRVRVQVFRSADLPGAWQRLDRFEGREYERVVVPVEGLGEGTLPCWIYVLRVEPGGEGRPAR